MARLSKKTLTRARAAAAKLYAPLAGLAVAAAIIMPAMAAAAIPPTLRDVEQWSIEERIIPAESGTRFAGPYNPNLIPFLGDIMRACSPQHPSSTVTILASAQCGKSTIGESVIGHRIQDDPCGIVAVLPSHEEAMKYSEVKIENMINASPGLARCVFSGHGKSGSKVMRKRFKGGYLQFASATASKNLQMLTFGLAVNEEVSEWPRKAGDRGDPHEQVRARGITYGSKFKEVNISTPAKSGTCKQTELFMLGTQRYLFWQCVHCGDWYHLRFEHMERYQGRAIVNAPCCGTITEHKDKAAMAKTARFIPLFVSEYPDNPLPFATTTDEDGQTKLIDWVIRDADIDTAYSRRLEGRDESYRYWQAMVPLPDQTWIQILDKYDAAEGDPEKLATFSQQTLGEAFELATKRPKWKKLLELKGGAPRAKTAPIHRRRIPNWAGFVTMSADLQGIHGEWAAYAHGPNGMVACIDHGIIAIDPLQDAFWTELRVVFGTRWESDHMRPQVAIRYGVDTGGKQTQTAYDFIRSNPDVHGIMGMKGASARFNRPWQRKKAGRIKTADGRDTEQRVELLQINTHLYKKLFYVALNNSIEAFANEELTKGAHFFFHPETDEAFFKQVTAEYLYEDKAKDIEKWVAVPGQSSNEQLDLAVYGMCLADVADLGRLTTEDWTNHFIREAIDPKTVNMGPLEALMQAGDEKAARLPRHRDLADLPTEDHTTEAATEGRAITKPNWLTKGINKE